MPQRSIAITHEPAVRCAAFSEHDNAVWFGTSDGRIVTCRLMDRRVTERGTGYNDLVAVLPAPDGLGVVAVERSGAILEVDRADAARTKARVLFTSDEALAGACLTGTSSLAIVSRGANARVHQVSLVDAGVNEVVADLDDPVAVVSLDTGRIAVVHSGGTAWSAIDLASGATITNGALSGSLVVALDGGSALVVADGQDGSLTEIDVAAPSSSVSHGMVGSAVRALTRWGSMLLALTAESIELIEWKLNEGSLPIRLPVGPAFARGYLRGEFNPADIEVSAADIVLDVEEGTEFATISAALEPPGPQGQHRFRIVAGSRPGEFHVSARFASSGVLIGLARFRITRHWPSEIDGPPVVVTGKQMQLMMWGGGPPGPQNIPPRPAPEFYRIAVVAVDTLDRRLASVSAFDATWRRHVVGDMDPATRSLRRYVEEVSFRNTPAGSPGIVGTTVELTQNKTFGPVNLSGWGDHFEYFRSNDPDPWAGWGPTEVAKKTIPLSFCDWLAERGDAGAVLRQIDAVVFVVQTATEDRFKIGTEEKRPKYIWGQAWLGNFEWRVDHPDGATSHSFMTLPTIYLPTHLPSMMPPDRPLQPYDAVQTLCHEIGHSFGSLDLYNTGDFNPEVEARTASGADLMAGGDWLPHYSLATRMRFGWVHPSWLATFNFANDPTGGTVVLQSIETMTRAGPRPGRKAGIEVRVMDGWNYYFEHRHTQPTQMGDQRLTDVFGSTRVLIGTDVVSRQISEVARPDILMLPRDADNDGPALTAVNTDYEESDVSRPERMHDFRVVYEGVEPGDPEAVRVRVVYERANRAELQIRPAPGRGNWKSPDIDLNGPAGLNTVAKGLKHTVIVNVRNGGTVKAERVHVKVSWLPFTSSPGTWSNLPDPAPQDILPNTVSTFTTEWSPPASLRIADLEVKHFCVSAVVDRYVDPRDPSQDEIVVANNRAQSNFDASDAPSGSPSDRMSLGITISNRLSRRATYLNIVEQTQDYFRAYLRHAWVRLAPGETRAIELAYESLAGDAVFGRAFEREFERIASEPNLLSVASLVLPEERPLCQFPALGWGLNLSIRAGHRTGVRDLLLTGEIVHGFVMGTANGNDQPVTSGTVNVVLWLGEREEEQFLISDSLDAQGSFHALVPGEILAAIQSGREVIGEALYLGSVGWSASRSGRTRLA